MIFQTALQILSKINKKQQLHFNPINNQLEGFLCKFCNSYNDILTNPCWNCKAWHEIISPESISLKRISRSGEFDKMDNDRIELHKKFFNSEKLLASQMSDEQLASHIRTLSEICFEARAKLNASQSEDRERKAKLSPKSRNWLVSGDNNDVSDALSAVKERKARMSKADKLKEAMSSLGLASSDISNLMSNVEKTARSSDLDNITYNKNSQRQPKSELCRIESHESCPGSFNSEGNSKSCSCSCHKITPADNQLEDLFK